MTTFVSDSNDVSADTDTPVHFSGMFFGHSNMPDGAFGLFVPIR